MTERIVKKDFYRITFRLTSPLAVGSGDNALSDKDIIRDGQGNPYIPATTIAGVTRAILQELGVPEIETYFGDVDTQNAEVPASESRLIFYDGVMTDSTYHTSVRDSVKLDKYKTAVEGAKFDMEILEGGIAFRTMLEHNRMTDDHTRVVDGVIHAFLDERVRFGAKSTRGFGEIGEVCVVRKSFDLSDRADVDAFLAFDPYEADAWQDAQICEKKDTSGDTKERTLRLSLQQRGGLSIRRYTTAVGDGSGQPDFEQMTVHAKQTQEVLPVVPGTSFAGAFRHRMRTLGLEETEEKELFGYIDDKSKRSAIRFSETVLEGATDMILSRNAINRFSGGTKDGALFTEKTCYGGKGELRITLAPTAHLSAEAAHLMAAAVADLHFGFLAVGGETSIGRGLFEVTEVNGMAAEEDDSFYEQVLKTIREVMCI